jgi:hypothetical protein
MALLHEEELHDLYLSPNIIRLIKSRIMRWAGHVARMGDWRGAWRVLLEKQEGKNHLEDLSVDEKIILLRILKNWDGRAENQFVWHRIVKQGLGGGLF